MLMRFSQQDQEANFLEAGTVQMFQVLVQLRLLEEILPLALRMRTASADSSQD